MNKTDFTERVQRMSKSWLHRWVLGVIVLGVPAAMAPSAAHETGHSGAAGQRQFQVLKTLPEEAAAYQGPAAALVAAGIPQRYGQEEWAAVVMAHEFHQHIGIMTVIGAKMAVRARELLNAPGRAVNVVTETGPQPPYSCAIDGIQAAIGSTYAQQLIAAPPVETPRLAATFEYKDRKVRLALKPAYAKRIGEQIQAAIEAHGDLTPAYFKAIEDFSYTVWAEFDRREIFLEEAVAANGEATQADDQTDQTDPSDPSDPSTHAAP